MKESIRLFKEMDSIIVELLYEGPKALEGNKSAARRTRKLTKQLEKVMKDFRKVSVKEIG